MGKIIIRVLPIITVNRVIEKIIISHIIKFNCAVIMFSHQYVIGQDCVIGKSSDNLIIRHYIGRGIFRIQYMVVPDQSPHRPGHGVKPGHIYVSALMNRPVILQQIPN